MFPSLSCISFPHFGQAILFGRGYFGISICRCLLWSSSDWRGITSGYWQRREVACLVYSESSARRARSLSFCGWTPRMP